MFFYSKKIESVFFKCGWDDQGKLDDARKLGAEVVGQG